MIKIISEAYTLQEETTRDGKISTTGELVVKPQCMKFIQDNTKHYWGKLPQKNNIIVSTCTIVHPCLDDMAVMEVKIPKGVFDGAQARKAIQRCPICLTESDYYYIINKVKCRYIIEYERKMIVDDSCE